MTLVRMRDLREQWVSYCERNVRGGRLLASELGIGWMLEAAIAGAANYLNVEVGDLDAPLLPASVKAAVLLVVGDLYVNREAVGTQPYSQNPTYERLLKSHKKRLAASVLARR